MGTYYARGSELQFTPDNSGWMAGFKDTTDGETWVEQVIGWAIVAEDTARESDLIESGSHIEPVLLPKNTAWPVTISRYLDDHGKPRPHPWLYQP